MKTEELKELILGTDDPDIAQEEIDAACYRRLRALCGDHGCDGQRARTLLDMAADMIECA